MTLRKTVFAAQAVLILLAAAAPMPAQDLREIVRLGRGAANTLGWQPDGDRLAIGSSTGIWLLDEHLNVIAQFGDQTVTTLAWSPDGAWLAATTIIGEFCSFRIWDVNRRKTRLELRVCADRLAWSPQGQYIAAASPVSQQITILDAAAGDPVLTNLPGRMMTWSPDSRSMAVLNPNGIQIWDVERGDLVLEAPNQGYSDSLSWIDDSRLAALCTERSAAASLIKLCHINVHSGEISDSSVLLWRHPGEWNDLGVLNWNETQDRFSVIIAAGGLPPLVYVFNSGGDAHTYVTLEGKASAWQTGGMVITVLLDNGLVRNFDARSGDLLDEKNLFAPAVRALAWSPDGERIASAGGGSQQFARVWEPSRPDSPPLIILTPLLSAVRWSEDGRNIITFGDDVREAVYTVDIHTWDARTGKLDTVLQEGSTLYENAPLAAWNSDFTRLALSPDHRRVVLGEQVEFRAMRPLLLAMQWSPDGERLATLSAGRDSSFFAVEIWNAATGRRLRLIGLAASAVEPLLYWSHDGRWLALAARDTDHQEYHVAIYDAADGTRLLRYGTAQWYAPKLAWRPDDHVLAVELLTGVIFLDVMNGAPVGDQIPIGFISALAWSPDGQALAIGSQDGTIHIWDTADLAGPSP